MNEVVTLHRGLVIDGSEMTFSHGDEPTFVIDTTLPPYGRVVVLTGTQVSPLTGTFVPVDVNTIQETDTPRVTFFCGSGQDGFKFGRCSRWVNHNITIYFTHGLDELLEKVRQGGDTRQVVTEFDDGVPTFTTSKTSKGGKYLDLKRYRFDGLDPFFLVPTVVSSRRRFFEIYQKVHEIFVEISNRYVIYIN